MGGPNRKAARKKTINISLQPTAKMGSQASVPSNNADKLIHNLLFIDYFNIGILMP